MMLIIIYSHLLIMIMNLPKAACVAEVAAPFGLDILWTAGLGWVNKAPVLEVHMRIDGIYGSSMR